MVPLVSFPATCCPRWSLPCSSAAAAEARRTPDRRRMPSRIKETCSAAPSKSLTTTHPPSAAAFRQTSHADCVCVQRSEHCDGVAGRFDVYAYTAGEVRINGVARHIRYSCPLRCCATGSSLPGVTRNPYVPTVRASCAIIA